MITNLRIEFGWNFLKHYCTHYLGCQNWANLQLLLKELLTLWARVAQYTATCSWPGRMSRSVSGPHSILAQGDMAPHQMRVGWPPVV